MKLLNDFLFSGCKTTRRELYDSVEKLWDPSYEKKGKSLKEENLIKTERKSEKLDFERHEVMLNSKQYGIHDEEFLWILKFIRIGRFHS